MRPDCGGSGTTNTESDEVVPAVPVGTFMFLIAHGAQQLASWDGADCEAKA
jgi:hypothetical protein